MSPRIQARMYRNALQGAYERGVCEGALLGFCAAALLGIIASMFFG